MNFYFSKQLKFLLTTKKWHKIFKCSLHSAFTYNFNIYILWDFYISCMPNSLYNILGTCNKRMTPTIVGRCWSPKKLPWNGVLFESSISLGYLTQITNKKNCISRRLGLFKYYVITKRGWGVQPKYYNSLKLIVGGWGW